MSSIHRRMIPLCLSPTNFSFYFLSPPKHAPLPLIHCQINRTMRKIVIRVMVLIMNDEKSRLLKSVSCLAGIESLALDMKDRKITVVGDVDPVQVVSKLRKSWHTEILTIGPAKEPEKTRPTI